MEGETLIREKYREGGGSRTMSSVEGEEGGWWWVPWWWWRCRQDGGWWDCVAKKAEVGEEKENLNLHMITF